MAHKFNIDQKTGNVIVSGMCRVLDVGYCFEMSMEEFLAFREWHLGGTRKTIQETLPNVSPENREFLMTMISPRGWMVLFEATDS